MLKRSVGLFLGILAPPFVKDNPYELDFFFFLEEKAGYSNLLENSPMCDNDNEF